MRRREFLLAAGLGATAGLAGCGKGGASSPAASGGASTGSGAIAGEVKVTYQQFGSSKIQANFLGNIAKQFTAANPQASVKLQPITASENDYYTKLQLMMRSPRTAPDLVYEDTFLINSDIKAGYLSPLDTISASGRTGASSSDTAKAAAKAADGKTYGIPDGTDTRGLWFNKEIFAKAGLPADWQPKNWAGRPRPRPARSSRRSPASSRSTSTPARAPARPPSMQGFEMLLYGTGATRCTTRPPRSGSPARKGFKDALELRKTVYSEKLGPTPQHALDPNLGQHGRPASCCPRASSPSTSTAPGCRPGLDARPGRQAVARLVQGAGQRPDAHPERPGAAAR